MGSKGGSQVVGHKYYASVAKFIGFRIEKLLGVNFDKRKWIMHNPKKHPHNQLPIDEPDLFGENEGGVTGIIDFEFGTANQKPNAHYKAHDVLISGFPYKSYVVFHGTGDMTVLENVPGESEPKPAYKLGPHSFYHGNTNYMKDVLLWPKRTRVQNTDAPQWYPLREDGAIVCEIGSSRNNSTVIEISEQSASMINNATGLFYVHGVVQKLEQRELLIYYNTPAFSYTGRTSVIAGNHGAVGYTDDAWAQCNYYFNFGVLVGAFKFSVVYECCGDSYVVWCDTSAEILAETIIETEDLVDDLGISYTRKKIQYLILLKSGSESFFNAFVKATRKAGGFTVRTRIDVECEPAVAIIQNDASGIDINPIHKIREIITNPHPWGMCRDESTINDENFRRAADRIYDEGLGVSWAIKDKDCIEAIEELCHHIDAGVRINRNTGKYEVVLFRDDWQSDLHRITESQIKSMQPELTDADELINHIDVSFYDRDNIKDGSFSISENGSIKTTGIVNAENVDFPYFQNMRNAEMSAQWKLKNLSTPKWSGTFTTGSREARKLQKYQEIELEWSRRWSGFIRARILNIGLGDGVDNTVSIQFEEIVPKSGAMTGTIVADQQSTAVLAPQSSCGTAFELPYYLAVQLNAQRETDDELQYDSSIGYVAALAMSVQSNSIYALLYSNDAGANPSFARSATVNYCEGLQLDQAVTRAMHSFVVKESRFVQLNNARRFAGATAETLIQINDEIMSFVEFNRSTNVLTVKRGVLDTGVFDHPADSYLFVFDNADLAVNSTQFYDAEHVVSKILTTTPSGIQDIEYAQNHLTVLRSRAIRPYAPANVKFNDSYWIETHVVSNDLVLTWSHRNRLQQTAGSHVDWYGGSVTVENGVTYSLELSTVQDNVIHTAHGINAATYTINAAILKPNRAHKLRLWAVRDGFDSYAIFEHNFFCESVSLILTATATKNRVVGNTVQAANITVNVDTALKANMQFDGSKIIGKTLPNSTITIEIED